MILFSHGLLICLDSVCNSCKKEDPTQEVPATPITKFCWVCENNIYQKNYECGTHMSNTGSICVGRTTRCDMTVAEIRAYESNLAGFSAMIVEATACLNGHPKKCTPRRQKSLVLKSNDISYAVIFYI
jgi:hypothetical protein